MPAEDNILELFRALEEDAKEAITAAGSTAALDVLEQELFGRKSGTFTLAMKRVASVPASERRAAGGAGNRTKAVLTSILRERRRTVDRGQSERPFNPTLPGTAPSVGHLHPLTQTIERVTDIFRGLNFEVVEGPELEIAKYNFDRLNIPRHHPARDAWDTFFVKTTGVADRDDPRQLVLRTHTSSVQARAMETRRPPVRLIAPGRCFRHEATDASHESTFHQCEGLVIDRGINVRHLKWTLTTFVEQFFERKLKTRFRTAYYPFVEPGIDMDVSCLICGGSGCSVCKQTGWVELIPSGMVHPAVLKQMRVDPAHYSGFAFGAGIDRLMMLYYGVPNVRLSYTGDLRFIEQF